VDNAVYDIMVMGEEAEGGFMSLDLSSEGVGYAMDDNNADLVSAEMQESVDAAMEQIASGDLMVHDYTSDDSCPALEF